MGDVKTKLGEHLRLIHFTLVVTSMAVLINLWGGDFDKVQEELTIIQNMTKELGVEALKGRFLLPGVLEGKVRGAIGDDYSNQIQSLVVDIYLPEGRITAKFSVQFPVLTAFHLKSADNVDWVVPNFKGYSDFFLGGRPYYFEFDKMERGEMRYASLRPYGIWADFQWAPGNIAKFEDYWNALAGMRHAVIFKKVGGVEVFEVVSRAGESVELNNRQYNFINQLNMEIPNNITLYEVKNNVIQLKPGIANEINTEIGGAYKLIRSMGHYFNGDNLGAALHNDGWRYYFGVLRKGIDFSEEIEKIQVGDVLIALKGVYEFQGLAAQKGMLKRASKVEIDKMSDGSFSSSFPNLYDFLSDYKYRDGMSFGVLESIVNLEARRGGSSFDIFGVSIKRKDINFWGVFAIFIIQIYFILHLLQFRKVIGGEEDVVLPWIGVYAGWINSVAIFISIFVLPVSVVVIVACENYSIQGFDGWNIGMTLGGVALAVWSTALMIYMRIKNVA